MLVPTRRRGAEILDDPATDPAVRERSQHDVRRSNVLLGGLRAALAEVERLLPSLGPTGTLLDVGTGLADIPLAARERARKQGVALIVLGVEGAESLSRLAARSLDGCACADARHLPFPDASIDVVICSQLLHHFEDGEIPRVLRELDRVARRHVIVADLQRSWLAACGFWLVSWPLRFSPVTRHDGTLSVLRGFTGAELARHVQRATGRHATVRRHIGWRLTASWEKRAP
jgi:SAM-dependent methyltransferase